MHSFVRNLITEWRRLDLATDEGTVVAAISGGADSLSLLLAMHDLARRRKLKLRLVAAHFNHGLRGAESEADEAFVRDLTTTLGIELAVGHGEISPDGNLEQNAREARYRFLAGTAHSVGAFAVVVAHTMNDQAETLLINLIRGSGLDGLSGMRPLRVLDDGVLLARPLLTWAKRGDTEAYCNSIAAAYRHDTMNDDTAFKRVRIRKVLLPLLRDMNPNIVETLANTARLMQHANQAVTTDTGAEQPEELVLKDLRRFSPTELNTTIRAWLGSKRRTTRALGLKHIDAVSRLVSSEKSGRIVQLPNGSHVERSGGKLRYVENGVEKALRAH